MRLPPNARPWKQENAAALESSNNYVDRQGAAADAVRAGTVLPLMRDIAGAKVDVALLRGKKAGGVRLSITPTRDRSDFRFGVDNRTQSGLGTGQLRAAAQLGFVDGARVHVASRAGFAGRSYDLASAGGGVRISYNPNASLSLEGARAIGSVYEGADEGWRFNIGWRLKIGR